MTQAAGKLNHRVELWSQNTTQDVNGNPVFVWSPQGSVWAEVVPLSAREFVSAAAMQSKVVARITLRYRSDIQPTWKIRFRSIWYNIEGVLPDAVSGLEYMTLPVSYGIEVTP